MPTLDDLPKMPVVVKFCVPCDHASCTTRSATRNCPGTATTSSGLVSPYSIAADAVTILFTEPGSYGLVTAALPSALMSSNERGLVGSNALSLASAYTSPVCASMITPMPLLAPLRVT